MRRIVCLLVVGLGVEPRFCLPVSAAEGFLTITHPTHDVTLRYAAGASQLNASLRYEHSMPHLAGAPHARLCVEVQRARADAFFAWFAEGCFVIAQPITLMLPAQPSSFLIKAALAEGDIVLARAQVEFATAVVPPFEPSYEWGIVPPGASVPAGLDVQMALDGAGSLARIPDPFRLQLSLSSQLGIFRADVYRGTTVGELAALLDAHALNRQRQHPEYAAGQSCAILAMVVPAVADDEDRANGRGNGGGSHGDRLDSTEVELPLSTTAEGCELFSQQRRLRVHWRACDHQPADIDWGTGGAGSEPGAQLGSIGLGPDAQTGNIGLGHGAQLGHLGLGQHGGNGRMPVEL
jgi:hypothetical protein